MYAISRYFILSLLSILIAALMITACNISDPNIQAYSDNNESNENTDIDHDVTDATDSEDTNSEDTAETCSEELVACEDICLDLFKDIDNCGQCGNECEVQNQEIEVPICVNGTCEIECRDSLEMCSNSCVDLDNDPNNCGACGNTCLSARCESRHCAPLPCDEASDEAFGGGNGTSESPFTICSPDHLRHVHEFPEYNFALSADIILDPDTDLEPFPPFSGSFNGFGFTIYNVNIYRSEATNIGLFSQLYEDGEIVDLSLGDLVIRGNEHVGGLVGLNYGSIANVRIAGQISGSHSIGGVVGRASQNSSISDAHFHGAVSGQVKIGGLVGHSSGGSISRTSTHAEVSGENRIGGLIGTVENTAINQSFASGDTEGVAEAVGGLIGQLIGAGLVDSYATASATGRELVGGLIGLHEGGQVSNTYAAGPVTGNDNVSGLIGGSESTLFVDNSYWDSDVMNDSNFTDSPGTKIGSSEFATIDIFEDWDFDDIWSAPDDNNPAADGLPRPRLKWEFD